MPDRIAEDSLISKRAHSGCVAQPGLMDTGGKEAGEWRWQFNSV